MFPRFARRVNRHVRYPRHEPKIRTRVCVLGLEWIQARGTHRDKEVAETLRAYAFAPRIFGQVKGPLPRKEPRTCWCYPVRETKRS